MNHDLHEMKEEMKIATSRLADTLDMAHRRLSAYLLVRNVVAGPAVALAGISVLRFSYAALVFALLFGATFVFALLQYRRMRYHIRVVAAGVHILFSAYVKRRAER